MADDWTLGGLHHVTALAGAAQSNLDFYIGHWGLRLVKRTVNFDDPATHHFYYSSAAGAPGTVATFFPWGRFRPHRKGSGQIDAMAFAVPEKFAPALRQRMEAASIPVDSEDAAGRKCFNHSRSRRYCLGNGRLQRAFRSTYAAFRHVVRGGYRTDGGSSAIPGFFRHFRRGQSHTLRPSRTGRFGGRAARPGAPRGRLGAGMIHHVAFRVSDEATQLEWRAAAGAGLAD